MRLAKRSIKKDETLVTDQRITILIGANDHGKSNLLAAIRCLNNDHPIEPDDRNWDLNPSDPVEITWHFSVDDETIQKLKEFGPRPRPTASTGPAGAAAVQTVSPYFELSSG